MFTTRFGIEIEMTGITREKAANTIGEYLGGAVTYHGGSYSEYHITTEEDGRVWKVMYDGSIYSQRKQGGETFPASREYSVEVVSPILTYEQDIEDLQEIIRVLRKAGAFTTKDLWNPHSLRRGRAHPPNSPKLHQHCGKQERPFLQSP